MKKILFHLFAAVFAVWTFTACEDVPDNIPEEALVTVYDGPIRLSDQNFNIYFGDKEYNSTGVYSIVLSDAMCYKDEYDKPYIDSEGDMLVLELHGLLQESGTSVRLPEGEYVVGETKAGSATVNPSASYVERYSGSIAEKWSVAEGKFIVSSDPNGYGIVSDGLVLARGSERISVKYTFSGNIGFSEFGTLAPSLVSVKDDLVDMPFAKVEAAYYGDLYAYGTGNYLITLYTRNFSDSDVAIPGCALVLNFFGDLYGSTAKVTIAEGTYEVHTSNIGVKNSMLYGMDYNGTPFGTYCYQVDKNLAQAVDYLTSGTLSVTHVQDGANLRYRLDYDLKSASRSVKGTWLGKLDIANYAEDSDRVILSTLDHDVETDLADVERAYLTNIEKLSSTVNTADRPRYDIANVWRVSIAPRDFSQYDKWRAYRDQAAAGENEDREDSDSKWKLSTWDALLKYHQPWGDAMYLEFVLPLEASYSGLAPVAGQEYVYTIQPSLALDDKDYGIVTSRMGRPYDDMFDPKQADNYYFVGNYDHCNSRRGFTWSEDGYRGVWYFHYKEDGWLALDEHAPAVGGTVSVTRTGDYRIVNEVEEKYDMYDFSSDEPKVTGSSTVSYYVFPVKLSWQLSDDADPQNRITGEWEGDLYYQTHAISDDGIGSGDIK